MLVTLVLFWIYFVYVIGSSKNKLLKLPGTKISSLRDDHKKNQSIHIQFPIMTNMNWKCHSLKIYVYISHTFPSSVHWEDLEATTPCSDEQIQSLTMLVKEPVLLGEIARSRSGSWSVQGEPGTSWVRNQGSTQRLMGMWERTQKLARRGFHWPNLRHFDDQKEWLIDCNILNKQKPESIVIEKRERG